MRLIYWILWLTLCHRFILTHLFSSVFRSQPFTQSQPDCLNSMLDFPVLLSRLFAHCPLCLFLSCLSLFCLSKWPNFLPDFVSACSLPFSCLPIFLIPESFTLQIIWVGLPTRENDSLDYFLFGFFWIVFNEILSSITTVLCCIRTCLLLCQLPSILIFFGNFSIALYF